MLCDSYRYSTRLPKGVANALKSLKNNFPDLDVVVGNIATADAAKFL